MLLVPVPPGSVLSGVRYVDSSGLREIAFSDKGEQQSALYFLFKLEHRDGALTDEVCGLHNNSRHQQQKLHQQPDSADSVCEREREADLVAHHLMSSPLSPTIR